MLVEQRREYKKAYIKAVQLCKINRNLLRELHGTNQNIIDKWLYVDDRYPDFKALFELWNFIKNTDSNMPPSLHAIIDGTLLHAEVTSAKYMARKNIQNSTKPA